MNISNEKLIARSPGITYQQLLDTDTHPVPDVLRMESPRYLGSADISKDRYTTSAFHDLEVERIWKRVWQFACREEDIPRPGDHTIYNIAGMSFLIIRGTDMAIKAYPNACLPRGRRLKDYDGHCAELRCAFHAFRHGCFAFAPFEQQHCGRQSHFPLTCVIFACSSGCQ